MTFENFNVYLYFWAYALTVVFFPLATLGIYLLLTRAMTGEFGRWGPRPRAVTFVEAIPAVAGWRAWAVPLSRTLFVGIVLGFEAAIVLDQFTELVAAAALAYTVAIALVSALVARRSADEPFRLMGSLNMFAAPLTVAALWGVSESTNVTVSSTGEVRDYRWLPAWLAFGAAAALLVFLARELRRRTSDLDRNELERKVLLLVVAPVGLFLFVAALPGELGTMNFFEEGQLLSGAELTRGGAFPWRDLIVAHGLLQDVANALFGSFVIEDSRWGAVAGEALVLEPLAWIGVYYVCAYAFGANWLFLLGTQLMIVTERIYFIQVRFLLVPLALLLLVALLRRPTVVRAVAFATILAAQVIVTPEALTVAAAFVGTLFLFELYYYERGTGLVAGFRRTLSWLAVTSMLLVAWAIFLLPFGALDDWWFSYRALIPGHVLTGGIPLRVLRTQFEVWAPVVLVLVSIAFVLVRTRQRKPLAYQDWAMIAVAGLTALYYLKFLSYADGHVFHSFSAAVPLLFYAVYRAVTFGEATLVERARRLGVRWIPARHTLTVPLLVVLLISPPLLLQDVARGVPGRFDPVASQSPEIDRIGYARSGENDIQGIRDIERAVAGYLGPGDAVFDFSNSPGLFYYLLERPTPTRYTNMILAARRTVQEDLLRELEASKPKLVAFTSNGFGLSLPSWDGIPNQVRHYDVSQYLLDNYVPVADVHGYVLMRPRDSGARPVRELYFRDGCYWGNVPNFFTPAPVEGASSVTVPLRRVARGHYELTLPDDASSYRWLELRTQEPLESGLFSITDRLDGDPRRTISFGTLDKGKTDVRVKVGSCPQWRGYRQPGVLQLTTTLTEDIREVRLVR